MARPFSYPEVQQLEVGRSVSLDYANSLSATKQKIKGYAARCSPPKAFAVSLADGLALVTRLPDPEPEVA